MADKNDLIPLKHRNLKVTPTKIDSKTPPKELNPKPSVYARPQHNTTQELIQKISIQAKLIDEYEKRFKQMEIDKEGLGKANIEEFLSKIENLEAANRGLFEQNQRLAGQCIEVLRLLEAPGIDGIDVKGYISNEIAFRGLNKSDLISKVIDRRVKQQAIVFRRETEGLYDQIRIANSKISSLDMKIIDQDSELQYKDTKVKILEDRLKIFESNESTLVDFLTDMVRCIDNIHFGYYKRFSDTDNRPYQSINTDIGADKHQLIDIWAFKSKCDTFLIHLSNKNLDQCKSIIEDLTNSSKLIC